jgi:hypothetical protein
MDACIEATAKGATVIIGLSLPLFLPDFVQNASLTLFVW